MAHRATHPLNPAAVQSANRALYAKHPELITNGRGRPLSATNDQDQALRSEWMALYAVAGGAVEPIGPAAANAIKSAVAENFSSSPAGGTVTPCPFRAQQPPPVPLLPAPPRALPEQPANEPPCELLKADVTCKHGRQAGPERVLMVVPQETDKSDTITVSLAMKGGCGAHPNWSHGSAPAGNGSSSSFSFQTAARASLFETSPQNWKSMTPVTTRISAMACSGVSGDCDVRTYPPGSASLSGEAGFSYKFYPADEDDRFSGTFAISCGYEQENVSAEEYKLELLDFTRKLSDAIGEKLIGNGTAGDDDDGLYPSYPGPDADDPPEPPQSEGKIELGLTVSGEWEWKEDPGSWKAYCESTLKVGGSPLPEVSGEFPVYGPPIPPKLKRWVDLGLYAGASGKVSFTAERSARFWPHDGHTDTGTWEAKGEGELEFSLFAKLLLVSEDFLSGSVGGKTGLKIEAAKAESGAPEVEFQREWQRLTATLSGEAMWGLFSYERDFVLFEGYKFKDPWIWKMS